MSATWTSGTIAAVLIAGAMPVSAQSAAPSSTYVSAAALAAVLEAAGDAAVIDANARSVQAGPNQLLVNIVRRTKNGMPEQASSAHNALSEVYYVIEGAGTLLTGGTMLDPTPEASSTGGNVRGKGIVGGETRRISVGDVVVIPAGTPHTFTAIDGTIVYLNLRIHPHAR